nr:immunoglobulin heavy chain junction region [Mus musculus]MBK4186250.1 immunoglobulin heavy chain junction region [Mus musculus]
HLRTLQSISVQEEE